MRDDDELVARPELPNISTELPGERLARWRESHWPPKDLQQYGELPIYMGSHDAVTAFAETLSDVMMTVSGHIFDECRGKTPRWMQIPKIHFNVERLNIAKSVAKASKRFSSMTSLVAKCGDFQDAESAKIKHWLDGVDGAEVVAHKPFVDMRAYVFIKGVHEPERVRFYEAGLVLAVTSDFFVQDQRAIVRRKRRDALSEPLATNVNGWSVFKAMSR